MVDWENTTAIGSGQGLIYAVADNEEEQKAILSSLESDLTALGGLNGEPIAREIHRREELYKDDHVDKTPDLVFDQRPGVHTSEAIGQDEVMSKPTNWRGENVLEGIALFHGDDIESQDFGEIQISDIAPTILHWMGHDVPSDMDGEVLTEIFAIGSDPAECEVAERETLPEQGATTDGLADDVEERLADIGYLE